MRKSVAALGTGLALVVGAASARAAPIPVTTLLSDFNAIIDQNYTAGSEVIGPVLIGGNLHSTNFINTNGSSLPIPITGYGPVNVFGNNLAGSTPIVFNSQTFIGGLNAGSIINPGPGSVLSGHTFPGTGPTNAQTFAADVWAPLTTLSTNLGGLAQNSTFNLAAGTGTFTATPQTVNGVPNVAVFDLTTAQLAATGQFAFSNIAAATGGAIINVTGSSFSNAISYPSPGIPQRNVIWNFENATGLTFNQNWEASVLAPFANVTNDAFLEGDLVALNYQGNAELHFATPDCPICGDSPSIPEPASIALLSTALGSLAALHRRRRS